MKTVGELDPDEANARLTRFVQQNDQLRQYLFDLTDRESDAAPNVASPTPGTSSPSPTIAPAQTENPSATPSPSPSPSAP